MCMAALYTAVAVKASVSAPAAEQQEEVFNEPAAQGPMLFPASPEALFKRSLGLIAFRNMAGFLVLKGTWW